MNIASPALFPLPCTDSLLNTKIGATASDVAALTHVDTVIPFFHSGTGSDTSAASAVALTRFAVLITCIPLLSSQFPLYAVIAAASVTIEIAPVAANSSACAFDVMFAI